MVNPYSSEKDPEEGRNVGCGDIKVSVMCCLLFHITARFDGFTGAQGFSKVHPDIAENSEGLPMECFNSKTNYYALNMEFIKYLYNSHNVMSIES